MPIQRNVSDSAKKFDQPQKYEQRVKIVKSASTSVRYIKDPQPNMAEQVEDGLSRLELQGLAFCEKLRMKLAENSNDDRAYLSFLRMLNDHSIGFVELQMYVSDLVHDCPVIMKDLSNFLHALED